MYGKSMSFLLPKALTVLFFAVFFNFSYSQSITGKILSDEKVPVVGVSILLKDKKISETDYMGVFVLSDTLQFPIKLRLEQQYYHSRTITMTQNNAVFTIRSNFKLQQLGEVTLASAYQREGKLILPTAKVSSEKFEQYSPIDLVSAINETPGVYIQSGAINTNRITIRGVGSRTLYGTNKIRAYFNGIPITNGGGETVIDLYDPENLQMLEIIKGPKATKYGTNLGGTLLLNSKKLPVGEALLKNNLTLGSFGLSKNSISAGVSDEKFSVNLNYDYLRTDGFRENNNYDRKAVLLTSTYNFNSKNELSLLVNYVDYFAQIPSSISKTAFEENPSQAAFTWKTAQGFEKNKKTLVGLSFTHRFSENFNNTSSVFYTYLDHYEPRPFNILEEFTNGYGARTVFEKDFIFLKNSANLSFGAEFYKDNYNWRTIANLYEENNGNGSLEGALLSDNVEKRDNLNVFATITLPLTEKLKVQFGLNFNKTNYRFYDQFNFGEANKNAESDFHPIFAPNANFLYQFTENISSYFNFSRGFNYPSIEETLTPEGIINPDLGPEKGFNYELGSDFFLFKRRLHFRVAGYLLDIDDLLVAQRVGDDQYIGRNAGNTEHKGIELQVSYFQPIFKSFYISPFLNAEITDHKFIDFVDGDNDFSGNQLTGVPDKKINGGVNFGFDDFTLNTNFLYIGEIPMNDSNLLYSNSYTVFNAKAAYKKHLSQALTVEISAGINNFTDQKYASSILINATGFGDSEPRFYYPGMPRNWFGGIKVKYEL